MWKKTVINRSSKYVPISVDIQRHFAVDDAVINLGAFKEGGELDFDKVEKVDHETGEVVDVIPDDEQPAGDDEIPSVIEIGGKK